MIRRFATEADAVLRNARFGRTNDVGRNGVVAAPVDYETRGGAVHHFIAFDQARVNIRQLDTARPEFDYTREMRSDNSQSGKSRGGWPDRRQLEVREIGEEQTERDIDRRIERDGGENAEFIKEDRERIREETEE